MTRTALLQLLDHPTAIAPAEVQELEQLARAFPYCQTAHLLLAKAAHDQGTMLASQRLRRAATYAADRVLLRQLIEQVVEEPEAEVTESESTTMADEASTSLPLVLPGELPAVQPEPDNISAAISIPAPVMVMPQPEPVVVAPEPEVPPVVSAPITSVEAVAEKLPLLTESLVAASAAVEPIVSKIQKFNINQPAAIAADSPTDAGPDTLPAADTIPETPVAEADITEVDTEAAGNKSETEVAIADTIEPQDAAEPEIIPPSPEEPATEPAATEESTATAALVPTEDTASEEPEAPSEPTEPATLELIPIEPEPKMPELEIPATAPPIRPPEEAGSARFEYGLQEESPPPAPLYELPLVDEWAAAATPLALAGSDDLTLELPGPAQPLPPKWTAAAFTGDTTLGYALDEGSRLGFGLGLLTEALLEKIQAEHESTLAHEIVAAPRPAPLPPTEVFFEPDMLLLEHWATHRPVVPPTPSSSELINSFLRRQPRLTRPAMLPPAAGAQADLSVKSTRTEPELATEGLARILARQGKIDRAIEIYQRLMVKQPEKMAYFVAQIQQLQPPA